MKKFLPVMLFLSLSGLPAVASAQMPSAQQQLRYVLDVQAPSSWDCLATPRNGGDGIVMRQSMTFEFVEPHGIGAWMKSTGTLYGRDYTSRIFVTGKAQTQASGMVRMTFDQVEQIDQDPLPNGHQWSDPSTSSSVLDFAKNNGADPTKPYDLVGMNKTEYGIDDVRCSVSGTPPVLPVVPTQKSPDEIAPVDYLLSVKPGEGYWHCALASAASIKDSNERILLRPDHYKINFRRGPTGQYVADISSKSTALGQTYSSVLSKVAEVASVNQSHLTFKAAFGIERDNTPPSDVFWSDPFSEVFQIRLEPRRDGVAPYSVTGAAQYKGSSWGGVFPDGESPFSCNATYY